jgi:beta-aspartyl-peptidase (threonine type)
MLQQSFAMAIHGGAGPDSDYIRKHVDAYKKGLEEAAIAGREILRAGGSAIDAVERAVISLEDNPLFNAGRGSAINSHGKVEMSASIMDGAERKAGAVSVIRCVKNPVSLSRYIMEKSHHVLLTGEGAMELARDADLALEPDAYFITEHQYDAFIKERDKNLPDVYLKQRVHGTVGAVALDMGGNLAAATSTGGTTNCLRGRISDSCVIGAGCFADNRTCAVSATGDGECIIKGVIAYDICALVEHKRFSLQRAADEVVHVRNKDIDGDIGVICINPLGEIVMSFNSQRMHRACVSSSLPLQVNIYHP